VTAAPYPCSGVNHLPRAEKSEKDFSTRPIVICGAGASALLARVAAQGDWLQGAPSLSTSMRASATPLKRQEALATVVALRPMPLERNCQQCPAVRSKSVSILGRQTTPTTHARLRLPEPEGRQAVIRSACSAAAATWRCPLISDQAVTIQGSLRRQSSRDAELLDLGPRRKDSPIPVTPMPLGKAQSALL